MLFVSLGRGMETPGILSLASCNVYTPESTHFQSWNENDKCTGDFSVFKPCPKYHSEPQPEGFNIRSSCKLLLLLCVYCHGGLSIANRAREILGFSETNYDTIIFGHYRHNMGLEKRLQVADAHQKHSVRAGSESLVKSPWDVCSHMDDGNTKHWACPQWLQNSTFHRKAWFSQRRHLCDLGGVI